MRCLSWGRHDTRCQVPSGGAVAAAAPAAAGGGGAAPAAAAEEKEEAQEKVSGSLSNGRVGILTNGHRRSPTTIWALVCLTNHLGIYIIYLMYDLASAGGRLSACRRQMVTCGEAKDAE